MATMIPDKPREFEANSLEDIMFDELANLPREYYVFHSFSIVSVTDSVLYESETDFVVFHPEKGLLCIEAKAGQINYTDGHWRYGSGGIMSHDGPYNQADINKWKLGKYMEKQKLAYLKDRCKMLHAVWFPSISKSTFEGVPLPSEADMDITLTSDTFGHIEEEIERIFTLEVPRHIRTDLNAIDIKNMINRVLAPSFNLVSIPQIKANHDKIVFKKMLKEQMLLLNYLEEQNNAVINGLAGTGKTIMAVEKARRHADEGEKVLFFCYNKNLKKHLQDTYDHENIFFYTIDGLACKLCDTVSPNYSLLKEILEDMYIVGNFPYQHIVIDEGQDFGKRGMEEAGLIELLKMNVLNDESKNGTFYLFYDKNQMVQSYNVPGYINDADCRLTLYRNCRNTENIAVTSLRLLGTDKKPRLFQGSVVGDLSEMFFAYDEESTLETLNAIIKKNWELGYNDITILTCKTEINSIISNECSDGVYLYQGKKVRFATCRTFKGLESDVVILVDMDNSLFELDNEQLMYVGSSRARLRLACISALTEKQCEKILDNMGARKSRNVKKSMAVALNAKYVEIKR